MDALSQVVKSTEIAEHRCPLHGDRHLMTFALQVAAYCDYFIETGTFHGETLKFIAENCSLMCVSCEPKREHYEWSKKYVGERENVIIKNMLSPDILEFVRYQLDPKVCERTCMFFLDAHSYGFQWPLREEVKIITENFEKFYIFIDDFKNPFVSSLGYDSYEGQVCGYEFIRESVVNPQDCYIYYPTYDERTSDYGPRGWAMVTNQTNLDPDPDKITWLSFLHLEADK